jgi:hypothetical protein
MGQGREKGRVGVHAVLVDGWCGAGARGRGLAKSSSNQSAKQYLGAAPIQGDDAGADDTSADAF